MSDLIAQLVARTLTSAPAVRPRLEPLFSGAPAIEGRITETIARPHPPSALRSDAAEAEITVVPPPPRIESSAEPSETVIEHREIISERGNSEKPTPPPQPAKRRSLQAPAAVSQPLPIRKEVEAIGAAPTPPRVKTSRQVAPEIRPAAVRFEKEEAPPSAAPIVRVTIGRIDVRAAPAPATPTRKIVPPPPPTLTLDAYLNSRKGGAR